MSTTLSQSESQTWPDEVVQLLDDHHLVVCADAPLAADRFAESLTRRLRQLAETQVIEIDGTRATDITAFCGQIEKQITGVTSDERRATNVEGASLVARRSIKAQSKVVNKRVWWRDIASVIQLLRNTADVAGAPKHRYFIWKDADALLRSDPTLFSHLVNALLGVAAEQEHITRDSLVLQRAVFIGSDALAAYAEKPDGQFHRWLDEEGSPFWEVASVLDGPPVRTYRLEGAGRG